LLLVLALDYLLLEEDFCLELLSPGVDQEGATGNHEATDTSHLTTILREITDGTPNQDKTITMLLRSGAVVTIEERGLWINKNNLRSFTE